MIWLSIAIVVITTEILAYLIFVKIHKIHRLEDNQINALLEKMKSLEDQISSIRVAQGMRRRDG